ncbi:MAG: hypothetical protein AMXMBFR12_06230 [Candidatus Babeliales bacterium]
MLHWQVPKWLSKFSLEAWVIICSILLHLFVLIALFVAYQGTANFNVTISGSMINPDAEIVFMPLHRSIKQQNKTTSAVIKKTNSGSKSIVAPKDEPDATIVKIIQTKPRSKVTKESKKAVDKKNDKSNKETVAKKETKTEAKAPSKNEKPEQKVEEKKITPEVVNKVIEDTKVTNNNPTNSSIATDGAIDKAVDANIVYVGQEEMDSLQAQEYIQQELAQHWAPPAGMRSDLQAIITLTIDFEGVIKHIELTQASGNLLFDTAAKKAAAHITTARWAYGKKFAITFKP